MTILQPTISIKSCDFARIIVCMCVLGIHYDFSLLRKIAITQIMELHIIKTIYRKMFVQLLGLEMFLNVYT